MADLSRADLRRAAVRGTAIGVVAASHLVLLAWVLAPPRTPSRGPQGRPPTATALVLRVQLLSPAPSAIPTRRPARVRHADTPRPHPPTVATQQLLSPPSKAVPAAPASAGTPAPNARFIGGGGFDARLRATQAPPPVPKLPGGHRYLTRDLQFIPVEQQSIEGKVNRVAALVFGGFDPVCKNTEYELAKPRKQQIADGYTMRELEQRLRERHCR